MSPVHYMLSFSFEQEVFYLSSHNLNLAICRTLPLGCAQIQCPRYWVCLQVGQIWELHTSNLTCKKVLISPDLSTNFHETIKFETLKVLSVLSNMPFPHVSRRKVVHISCIKIFLCLHVSAVGMHYQCLHKHV